MHLCMYLKCAIGWRDWVQQRKRSIELVHDALSPSLILVLMCCMLLSPLLQLESIQEQLDGLSS